MANTVTVANLQADLSLNTGNFSEGVNNAAGATESLTGAILKADLVKGVLQGVANFAGKVAGLVNDAVGNFAEYEQLVGGVETLFGAGGMKITEYADSVGKSVNEVLGDYADLKVAENMVIENAHNAFKTVGIDANEYMKNVTSFSASLLQSMGGNTKKAAKVADMAMTDMADNANKMGTDMTAIQNAYQGFAKQNYTMLDNLKLGYGGTKSEMERLLKDAQAFSGIKYDINNLADVYEAIHVIQTEMGITGTTAKEAASTIEGSEKMMKASWQNLLTSMVTGGEWFNDCIDGFVESVQTYVKNLLPAIEGAMHGFSALIGALAPMLASELPGFVQKVLPDFVNAVTDIINGVLTALPGLLETLKGVAPLVSKALVDLTPNLIDFILEGIPQAVEAGFTLLTSLVSGLAGNVDKIVPQLTQGVIDMIDRLIDIINGDSASNLATAAEDLISNLAFQLVQAVPSVITQLTQLVQDLTAQIGTAVDDEEGSLLEIAMNVLRYLSIGLKDSITKLIPELTTAVADFISKIAELAASETTGLANAAFTILDGLVTDLGEAGTIAKVMEDLTAAVMAIIGAIIDVITGLDIATFANACASIVTQLADGIVAAVGVITDKLPELITEIVAWLTNPDNLTGLLSAALTIFGELVADIPGIIEALTTGLSGIVSGIYNYFKDHGGEILQGFKDAFAEIGMKLTEIWDEKIKPAFDDLGTKLIGWLTQFEWGQSLVDFVGKITGAFSGLWDKAKTAFEGEGSFGEKLKAFFTSFEWGQSLDNFVSGITGRFTGLWDKVKDAFEGENGLGTKIKGFFSSFDWGAILTIFCPSCGAELDLEAALTAFVDSITETFSGMWDKVKNFFEGEDGLGEKIKGFFTSFDFGTAISDFIGSITELFTGLWDSVKDAFEGENGLGRKIKDFFLTFDWGQTFIDFVDGIKKGFSDLWSKIKDVFEGAEGLGKKIKGFFSSFEWGATFLTFVQKIKTGITDKLDNIKVAFTGENGFIGKVKSWFGEFDLKTIIEDFIQKIKDSIEGAWDSFKQWFQEKIGGLFSGIKVPNWIKKLFGKGEGKAEDTTQMDDVDEMLVDMPANMLTIDYSYLEPIPEETLTSYNALADAINAINEAISGGEGGSGLNTALSGLPTQMNNVLAAAKTLADYLSTTFVNAIQTVIRFLCQTSEDSEGNINASGGNTLYTSMGWIFVLLQDIYVTSQLLAQYWSTEFISASEMMRTESGYATGTLMMLASVATAASYAFDLLAMSIWSVIDAYVSLNKIKGGSGNEATPTPVIAGAAAEGGPVVGGLTYWVGEEGPELFTPNRNGWIHSNDEMMEAGKREINIVNNFSAEVIGDEKSLSAFVTKATEKALEEAVYAAI